MAILLRTAFFLLLAAVTVMTSAAQQADEPDQENQCLACHGNSDVWEDDTLHLFIAAEDLAADVHSSKGILCHDCHGGNPNTFNLREAHAIEDGFRVVETPADVAAFCGHCHSDMEYMGRFVPSIASDPIAEFRSSVHGEKLAESIAVEDSRFATCTSCHPKHSMLAADDPQSSVHPRQLAQTCGECHVDQLTDLRKSVHHAAGEKNEAGAGTMLDCGKCHGENVHGMLPARDPNSPTFLDHQVAVCGSCHEKYLETYDASVHGHGLRASGLLVTAVCVDCHNAHDIFYAADKRSSLHAENVSHTCGKCHLLIEQRLAHSVHGRDAVTATLTSESATRGKPKRQPNCVDCHQGHDQAHPDEMGFRLQQPNRCGNCHADYAQRYGMSIHGSLTHLGYEPAAKCSDCHGAHDILPVADANSHLSAVNRVQTCRQCHTQAAPNFAAFDPHADPKDAIRYPWLHRITSGTDAIVYFLFGLFALHAFFWFIRSFIHALDHGRDQRLRPGQAAIVRFLPTHRRCYLLLTVSFAGLTLTGLPLKYGSYPWAQRLAGLLGGFESTSVWHRFFAVLAMASCLLHIVWGLGRIVARRSEQRSWSTLLWGPDSALPRGQDGRDAWNMVKWFLGFGRKPTFERWTYWEKFDYWAVYLAVLPIGLSGLMLWLPNLFCLVLPGRVLNVAQVIHADAALWIASLLFLIHFFNTHFRPEKFPLDLSFITGLVSEEHLRKARPKFLERLRREGQLDELRAKVPSGGRLWQARLLGLLILGPGLILLVAVMLAFLGK